MHFELTISGTFEITLLCIQFSKNNKICFTKFYTVIYCRLGIDHNTQTAVNKFHLVLSPLLERKDSPFSCFIKNAWWR